jgi:hypothetical protein
VSRCGTSTATTRPQVRSSRRSATIEMRGKTCGRHCADIVRFAWLCVLFLLRFCCCVSPFPFTRMKSQALLLFSPLEVQHHVGLFAQSSPLASTP